MWTAESLRCTAFFPEAPAAAVVQQWWHAVYGSEPETEVKMLSGAAYKAEAPFLTNRLVLALDPTAARVDWLLLPSRPPVPTQEAASDFPTIGGIDDSVQAFGSLIKKWVELKLRVQRLAFGAVLFVRAKDREDGYTKLGELLKTVHIDSKNSSDFFYQINRQRTLSIPGVGEQTINRLSKWAVALTQPLAINLTVGGNVVAPSFTAAGSAVHAMRLELDVSTAADFAGVFPEDALPATFRLLIEQASEIATKGDIP